MKIKWIKKWTSWSKGFANWFTVSTTVLSNLDLNVFTLYKQINKLHIN